MNCRLLSKSISYFQIGSEREKIKLIRKKLFYLRYISFSGRLKDKSNHFLNRSISKCILRTIKIGTTTNFKLLSSLKKSKGISRLKSPLDSRKDFKHIFKSIALLSNLRVLHLDIDPTMPRTPVFRRGLSKFLMAFKK